MEKNFKRLAWTVGIVGGLSLFVLRFIESINISGYDRKKFIPSKDGLIVLYRHSSLVEPAVMPFLFFPAYLFSLKFVPLSAPDAKKYYRKWWFTPFRNICIPIERGNPFKGRGTLRLMMDTLKEGRILVLAPEGGRTFKGGEFKVIRDGEIKIIRPEEVDWKRDKKIIRRFQLGIGWLVLNTEAPVLPIWTEGGEKILPNKISLFSSPNPLAGMRIKVGKPLKIEGDSPGEITKKLEDIMLRLGDEG